MHSLHKKIENEVKDKEFFRQESNRRQKTIEDLRKRVALLDTEKLKLKLRTDKEKEELTNANNLMEREKLQFMNFAQKIKSVTAMSLQLNCYFLKKANFDLLSLK
jgi:predicted nuclease with TOPRIM domain